MQISEGQSCFEILEPSVGVVCTDSDCLQTVDDLVTIRRNYSALHEVRGLISADGGRHFAFVYGQRDDFEPLYKQGQSHELHCGEHCNEDSYSLFGKDKWVVKVMVSYDIMNTYTEVEGFLFDFNDGSTLLYGKSPSEADALDIHEFTEETPFLGIQSKIDSFQDTYAVNLIKGKHSEVDDCDPGETWENEPDEDPRELSESETEKSQTSETSTDVALIVGVTAGILFLIAIIITVILVRKKQARNS